MKSKITLEEIKSTEKRLLDSICTFSYYKDYSIYQSKDFPNFYAGNGVEIIYNRERTLRDWELIFREYFNPDVSKHYTFTFEINKHTKPLILEAKKKKYDIEIEAYMACNTFNFAIPLTNDHYGIKEIKTKNDWMAYELFFDEVSKENDWYDPINGTKELFAKTRKTTQELGIQWFCIYSKFDNEILGTLGIFKNERIFRLQNIMVHPNHRRKKLATYLLSYIINLVLKAHDADGLVLITSKDYHAIDLYEKLGFKKFGEFASLMKFPKR